MESVGFSTSRSLTEAPPSSSPIRKPRPRASAKGTYSARGCGAEDRKDGERADDVGLADAKRLGEERVEGLRGLGWMRG